VACRNPACRGNGFDEVELSRRGRVWSYTTNHYAPPSPFVAHEPFEPYAIAAVELAEEKMVVLGQVDGDASELRVGAEVELVLAPLFADGEGEHMVWKWRLVTPGAPVR
jgi:uncharacterized OB-fold protein